MRLTDPQITQVYEILGVPQDGVGEVFSGLATGFLPHGESYDLSGVVAKINAKVLNVTDAQLGRLTLLLLRWDAITSSSPLQVTSGGGSGGTLASHPAERENIRMAVANILGLAVPPGGFVAAALRNSGGNTITR